MPISREDVIRVAQLANLELSPAEIEIYRSQLDSILTYISKLNELDTSEVAPMTQALPPESSDAPQSAAINPTLRDDAVLPSNTAAEILPQAPDSAPPYFRVPKVIDRS